MIVNKIKWLACTECGSEYGLLPAYSGCPACNQSGKDGALEVRYDLNALAKTFSRSWNHGREDSIWRYNELLPVNDERNFLTLGEGNTPLIRDAHFDKEFGFPNIYLKNEASNPTWSHKDRLNAVLISKAKELQASGITASSTGNHGISAAAYSGVAELPCYIFFPPETSSVYLRLTGFYGAKAFVAPWEQRGKLVSRLVEQYGWTPSYPFVEGGLSNPYGVEGYKTIAYELKKQLGAVPDNILAPVSEGNALCGIWKGFNELKILGITDKLPRLFGCLAYGANALERSFERQDDKVMILEESYSIATSTREKTAGVHILRYLRDSGGGAVSVDDRRIYDTMIDLGKRGYCVESASALPVACLDELIASGKIKAEEKTVCLVTSTGVKWPDLLAEQAPPPTRIEGTWESFAKEMNL